MKGYRLMAWPSRQKGLSNHFSFRMSGVSMKHHILDKDWNTWGAPLKPELFLYITLTFNYITWSLRYIPLQTCNLNSNRRWMLNLTENPCMLTEKSSINAQIWNTKSLLINYKHCLLWSFSLFAFAMSIQPFAEGERESPKAASSSLSKNDTIYKYAQSQASLQRLPYLEPADSLMTLYIHSCKIITWNDQVL